MHTVDTVYLDFSIYAAYLFVPKRHWRDALLINYKHGVCLKVERWRCIILLQFLLTR